MGFVFIYGLPTSNKMLHGLDPGYKKAFWRGEKESRMQTFFFVSLVVTFSIVFQGPWAQILGATQKRIAAIDVRQS